MRYSSPAAAPIGCMYRLSSPTPHNVGATIKMHCLMAIFRVTKHIGIPLPLVDWERIACPAKDLALLLLELESICHGAGATLTIWPTFIRPVNIIVTEEAAHWGNTWSCFYYGHRDGSK